MRYTNLSRELTVTSATENKAKCHTSYFIGRFATGLPEFSKKKSAENKWTLHVIDLSTIYLSRKVVCNMSNRFNFNKVAQYRQLTLAEAEEKTNNRKRSQDGYARWMMKSGTNRPGPFGEKEPHEGEKDEDEETARKKGLGLNEKDGDDEDDNGGNLDDYSSEMGEDWEHQEIFTDDDEAVAVDPVDREEFVPEAPAPPEIRQEYSELSKHGKELTKLLVKSGVLDDSYGEEYNDDDMYDDFPMPQPLAPKQKDAPKQEPDDNIPVQPGASGGNTDPVTEEELREVLMLMSPMTASDLIRNFPGRLETEEEKNAFKVFMKKMCKMVNSDRRRYVVLKENKAADPNEESDDLVS